MVSYTSIELLRMLSHPLTRKILAEQWPNVKCKRCGTRATSVCAVTFNEFNTGDVWVEFVALCAGCALSDYGRGVQSERPTIPFVYMPRRKSVDIVATVSNSQWHSTGGTLWT